MNTIIHGNNYGQVTLSYITKNSTKLIYIDPPYNTGKDQKRGELSYSDNYTNFEEFLIPRIMYYIDNILTKDGSIFIHLDWREVHYIKVALDKQLGRDHFMNEIIWAYDYGARQKNKWPTKHDSILWYVKDPKNYIFNYDNMDRIPYMAPGLVGEEKAAKGKTPTDVWWHTIVPTNGKEKTGYPTQKPIGILNRIIQVHSNPQDLVLDFFAGSGTTGDAAASNNRRFTLIDCNIDAVNIMYNRLHKYNPTCIGFEPTSSFLNSP